MTSDFKMNTGRRKLLQGLLVAGGALLAGFDKLAWSKSLGSPGLDPIAEGKELGVVDFVGEAPVPMEKVFGAGLDGRMYTDLSKLTPQDRVMPTEKFYIRTRASELLESQKPWVVRVGGLGARPFDLGLEDLKKMAKPVGRIDECGGLDGRGTA